MNYDLVFEGGGAKGMVFVGAYEEFVRRGHTFQRLLGTSAGAITAVLIAAGYTADEMLRALQEKEKGLSVFTGFMSIPPPFADTELNSSGFRTVLNGINLRWIPDFVESRLRDALMRWLAGSDSFRHVLALIDRGGWFAADKFVEWLKVKLDTGLWNGKPRQFSGMTLKQFHEATGVELSFVASDTTDENILVLNHRTAPACPIVWAVRMSMSIPLLWDEIIWKADWGSYRDRSIAGHAIVDGGLLSNFPIELFISDASYVEKLMGPKTETAVMGLLIDEKLPLPKVKGLFVDFNIKPETFKTVQRLRRLIDTATGAHDKMVIDDYEHLVVRLPAKGYGTTEFDMSDDRRAALVQAGRQAMADYFATVVSPSTKAMAGDNTRMKLAADRIAISLLRE